MTANFNWVDYTILSIFSFSILAGLFRGLVKELISVVTWCTAFILATLFAEPFSQVIPHSSKMHSFFPGTPTDSFSAAKSISLVSTSVSFTLIFLGTLLVGTLINYFVSRAVEIGGISIANRLLGAIFGFIRGFFISLIAIMLILWSPFKEEAAAKHSELIKMYRPITQKIEKWMEYQFQDVEGAVRKQMDKLNKEKIKNFMATWQSISSSTILKLK